MQQNNLVFEKKPLPKKLGAASLVLAGLGLALCIAAIVVEPLRASYNSILMFTYLMGLGMCSLFLIGIEYLTGAVWSVPFRRIGEYMAIFIFVAPIFAIPVIFNMHDIFHWSHHEAVETDAVLKAKSPYLNETFFYIRLVAVILIMALFAKLLIGNSAKQDKIRTRNSHEQI